MDRRTFIRRSLLAGGAVGVAGGGYLGLRSSQSLAEPLRELFVLDEVAYGVLVAVCEPVLALPNVDAREIAHRIDESLRYATPEAQDDLGLVLGVLENSISGLLTRGSLTLFSELTAEGRAAAMRRWGDSPVALLRGASISLKKLAFGVHYAVMENAHEVGYPGPPFTPPDPGPIEARKPLYRPSAAVAEAANVEPAE
ncbi:MAG: hypothetical protein AAFU77_01055 [Myxococcota bacterium]